MSNPKTAEVTLPTRQPMPTSPRAAAYAREAATRAGNPPAGPQRFTGKRAGGPTPSIPPLDGPPVEGMTMAAQASMSRRAPAQGGIIQQAAQPPQVMGLDLRPQDLLPAEAQSDPAFAQGLGSMYAVSQPRLAAKYGVERDGRRIPPQMLRPAARGATGQPAGALRPETIQDLEQLQKIRETSIKGESGELAAEEASAKSSAGGAASLGTSGRETGTSAEKPLTDQEVRDKIAKMNEFDLHQLHEMVVKDIINNKEQRDIIEARLEPLDLADLVVHYTIRQRVPIIPKVFEPEFESLRTEDDLNLKRMIVEEAKTMQIDDRYLMDKFSLLGMACAIYSINGKPLPSHRTEKGEFSQELLEIKFKHILRMPLPMIAALGPHYFWFDTRVRKLFVAEKIKNG